MLLDDKKSKKEQKIIPINPPQKKKDENEYIAQSREKSSKNRKTVDCYERIYQPIPRQTTLDECLIEGKNHGSRVNSSFFSNVAPEFRLTLMEKEQFKYHLFQELKNADWYSIELKESYFDLLGFKMIPINSKIAVLCLIPICLNDTILSAKPFTKKNFVLSNHRKIDLGNDPEYLFSLSYFSKRSVRKELNLNAPNISRDLRETFRFQLSARDFIHKNVFKSEHKIIKVAIHPILIEYFDPSVFLYLSSPNMHLVSLNQLESYLTFIERQIFVFENLEMRRKLVNAWNSNIKLYIHGSIIVSSIVLAWGIILLILLMAQSKIIISLFLDSNISLILSFLPIIVSLMSIIFIFRRMMLRKAFLRQPRDKKYSRLTTSDVTNIQKYLSFHLDNFLEESIKKKDLSLFFQKNAFTKSRTNKKPFRRKKGKNQIKSNNKEQVNNDKIDEIPLKEKKAIDTTVKIF